MNLEEENNKLKKQLEAAKKWMQKEVHAGEKIVQHQKTQKDTNNFYHENLEEIIRDKIYSFFPPEVLSRFPDGAVENILSSEIIYYHIIQGGHLDGTGVMIGYQKVLDGMIELYITRGFRKYVIKNKLLQSPKNIPIEKSLFSIIDKKYILSLGRLYEILKKIHDKKPLSTYIGIFDSYLKSRDFLKKSLLESDFLLQLEGLVQLHAISEKRHSGSISPDDTKRIRSLCTGSFENTNCLLYILAASQSVDI